VFQEEAGKPSGVGFTYYSSMAILLENYQLLIEIEKGEYPQSKEFVT